MKIIDSKIPGQSKSFGALFCAPKMGGWVMTGLENTQIKAAFFFGASLSDKTFLINYAL